MTTTGAPGSYVTPNTAMQTAVMWGYVSRSVAVYKYGASVVEYCRYAPPDTPGSSRLFHHSMCEIKKSTMYRGALSVSQHKTSILQSLQLNALILVAWQYFRDDYCFNKYLHTYMHTPNYTQQCIQHFWSYITSSSCLFFKKSHGCKFTVTQNKPATAFFLDS